LQQAQAGTFGTPYVATRLLLLLQYPSDMEKTQKQHIVVVGGGFGGVKTALELSANPDKFEITLVSDRADFWYFPTLYHTATGGTRSQSSIPLKELFQNKKVKIVEGKAETLDRAAKTITLADKTAPLALSWRAHSANTCTLL
jgi:NADH dehydrogenase FAD-containing subunit